MNPRVKNILIVIACVLAGGAVNMMLITISDKIIPPPEGADLKTMEGLKASMHLMQPKHFLMPFLAHALGTFVGSFLAAKFISENKMRYALGVGIWFLIGGTANVFLLPSPMWFNATDLILSYIPMAYIAGKLAQ